MTSDATIRSSLSSSYNGVSLPRSTIMIKEVVALLVTSKRHKFKPVIAPASSFTKLVTVHSITFEEKFVSLQTLEIS